MNIKDLEVYKLSIGLAVRVYSITSDFPKSETFGITSQLRRAAVSISCNMAEGAARNNPKELIQFLGISRGSCAEILTLIEISNGIGFLDSDSELIEGYSSLAKMLTNLMKSLRLKESTAKS